MTLKRVDSRAHELLLDTRVALLESSIQPGEGGWQTKREGEGECETVVIPSSPAPARLASPPCPSPLRLPRLPAALGLTLSVPFVLVHLTLRDLQASQACSI